MADNPQRPTEIVALYGVLTNRSSYTINAPGYTVYHYQGRPYLGVIICTPLWFDPDEDVEIEAPEDEAPETD